MHLSAMKVVMHSPPPNLSPDPPYVTSNKVAGVQFRSHEGFDLMNIVLGEVEVWDTEKCLRLLAYIAPMVRPLPHIIELPQRDALAVACAFHMDMAECIHSLEKRFGDDDLHSYAPLCIRRIQNADIVFATLLFWRHRRRRQSVRPQYIATTDR